MQAFFTVTRTPEHAKNINTVNFSHHLTRIKSAQVKLWYLLSGLGAGEDEVGPGEQAGPTRSGLRARRDPYLPERLVRQIG